MVLDPDPEPVGYSTVSRPGLQVLMEFGECSMSSQSPYIYWNHKDFKRPPVASWDRLWVQVHLLGEHWHSG